MTLPLGKTLKTQNRMSRPQQCGVKVRFSAYKKDEGLKRYGNLYEKICSMENLELALKNAKKGKGWYREVREIEERPYYYLSALQWMLQNNKYHTSSKEQGNEINIVTGDNGDQFIEGVGIPIGNYFSQYDGNFYLSTFDHWIKEEKHVKHYYRYMDDICIFASTKEELHQLLKEIDAYFKLNLKLRIKGNYQIFPSFIRGIDFVGYRIFLNYTLLRKTTCIDFKRKMTKIRTKVESGVDMNYSEWCSINSYKGWLKYCDSYRLSEKYILPIQPYADRYYENHIKKKGGKKHERVSKGKKYRKT